MLIIIGILNFYLIKGTLRSPFIKFIPVFLFLIPIYLGYNLPKSKVIKYNGILGLFAILIDKTPNIVVGM